MKKVLSMVLAIVMMSAFSISTYAAEPLSNENSNYEISILSNDVGELDPSCKSRANDYNAVCHKEWILDRHYSQLGAWGWTDITEKSDGSQRYHYSNIFVYTDRSSIGLEYSSGRKWGYGKVEVEVRANGPFAENRIFYGWA